jgi:hypothetical protein
LALQVESDVGVGAGCDADVGVAESLVLHLSCSWRSVRQVGI